MDRLVNIGDEVKDQITGFKGIAASRTEFLYGCVRVEVQPQKLKADKNREDSVIFDETQLLVTKKKAIKGDDMCDTFGLELGDEVKHHISGFTGIVNSITEYLFGPVRVAVHTQKMKDGKVVDGEFFQASSVKLIKKAKVTVAEPAKKAIKTKKSTGGPIREFKSAMDKVEKR